MNFEDYSINISPLPADDGGGFLVSFPDLPGCMADGQTIDEAISEAHDAFCAWRQAELEDKQTMPESKRLSVIRPSAGYNYGVQ